KTLVLSLGMPSNATLGTPASNTLTIVETTPAPVDSIVGRSLTGGAWFVAKSNGISGFTTAPADGWAPGVTWVDVQTGDFNGDGKADVSGAVLASGQWWAGLADGLHLHTSLWETWSPAVTWADVRLGDLNGDGKADLIGRILEDGQWWAGLSDGMKLH